VISGAVVVGFGDRFDEKSGTRFVAGSYYVNPAQSHHFVWFAEDAVLQVTGVGPWQLHPL
jgi:hypothetical protein